MNKLLVNKGSVKCKGTERFKTIKYLSKYSALCSTVAIKENIDIKDSKVIAFLKRKNVGYKTKKASTFFRDDIKHFVLEAPDKVSLPMKVN